MVQAGTMEKEHTMRQRTSNYFKLAHKAPQQLLKQRTSSSNV